MLCKLCVRMLRGGLGTADDWNGRWAVTFQHHSTMQTLEQSAKIVGCSICRALVRELQKHTNLSITKGEAITAVISQLKGRDAINLALKGASEDLAQSPYIYQLDFTLGTTPLRTFALNPTVRTDGSQLKTPKSDSTSSDEVLELSRSWIKKCKCADFWDLSKELWYPKRLLDLNSLRSAKGVTQTEGLEILSQNKDLDSVKIKLAQGQAILSAYEKEKNPRYVTLSHRWGANKEEVLKLTTKIEKGLQSDGVDLQDLPATFRDAILFSCRLDKVGYIWIDSMCIEQNSEKDWLEQSRIMDKIYAKSYLNISATASKNSSEGLFRDRSPEYLWEDEINLNWTGWGLSSRLESGESSEPLTRCTVIDVSFWEDLVDQAPVNQRGWVLQERLLCPRVLHFCEDQIAWECREFQFAEGHLEDLPTWKRRLKDIVDEGLFKGLRKSDGDRLREIRLRSSADPDSHVEDLHIFELWKRVVEVYSRTELSHPRDKLIALSGIATHFSEMFSKSTPCEYVAGMWSKPRYLESQLLWQVGVAHKDGEQANHSKRHEGRAPSFSWASLDTPQGIIYGDTTDYGEDRTNQLFFEIQKYNMPLADDENKFGMLKEGKGCIWLEARYLRRIEMHTGTPSSKKSFSHSWHFHGSLGKFDPIVYFDCPEADINVKDDAELYCMPAAFAPRTAHATSRVLICLLLKLQRERDGEYRTFRRFGLTKLQGFLHRDQQRALLAEGAKEVICLY